MTRRRRRSHEVRMRLGITHRLVVGVRQLFAAIRHVRTGGASTRTRARQKAANPSPRCPRCNQRMPHSADYRQHVHL